MINLDYKVNRKVTFGEAAHICENILEIVNEFDDFDSSSKEALCEDVDTIILGHEDIYLLNGWNDNYYDQTVSIKQFIELYNYLIAEGIIE